MTITNTLQDDFATIKELFGVAIQYQQSKSGNHWHGMNEALIRREIEEGLHWKILEDNTIAGFFSVAYNDAMVWGERDADPSIYLHRIVTNPAFRGRSYVKAIIAWAEEHGAATGRRFVRLDTHRDNLALNAYYAECGFTFCGVKIFEGSEAENPGVPKHYFGNGLSLFERVVPSRV